jgi:phosphatidylglycerophosphate synthase
MISFSRLVILVPWLLLCSVKGGWSLAILAAIIASDIFDGKVARALSVASPAGARVDVVCDAIVIFFGTIVLGLADGRYLISAALAALTLGSWVIKNSTSRRFSYTRFGRYAGAFSYALLAVASARNLLAGWAGIRALEWCGLTVTGAYMVLSLGENLALIIRRRR